MTARLTAALAAAATLAGTAQADPVDVVNALRADGCGGATHTALPVRRDPRLDTAAQTLAGRTELEAALESSGYPAASATSFHVRGSAADDIVRQILEERFCDALLDRRYAEAGFHQAGAQTWIVLAVREPQAPPLRPARVAADVLELVNAARAEARDCGRERLAATGPLTLSPQLNEAAALHARDMAARGTVTHDGSDGSNSGDRVRRTGYAWRAVGENVAGGQRDAAAVVAAWLDSPGHCATLMGAHFREMGIAYALAPDRNPAIYWAQVFAAPRPESASEPE